MINLNYSMNNQVESAYIITLKDNYISEKLSDRCAQSCKSINMPYKKWTAFDGTNNTSINIPNEFKDKSWIKWLKIMDHHLSISEIATTLSHFSLWAHCLEIDRPIVILEHDAIMVKPYLQHSCWNSITYLGSKEQKNGTMDVVSISPHSVLNKNYHFICRAHAYAIDPPVAKNLMTHLIQNGIHESLDIMIRCDLFFINQFDFCAYNEDDSLTTISSRKKNIALGSER